MIWLVRWCALLLLILRCLVVVCGVFELLLLVVGEMHPRTALGFATHKTIRSTDLNPVPFNLLGIQHFLRQERLQQLRSRQARSKPVPAKCFCHDITCAHFNHKHLECILFQSSIDGVIVTHALFVAELLLDLILKHCHQARWRFFVGGGAEARSRGGEGSHQR